MTQNHENPYQSPTSDPGEEKKEHRRLNGWGMARVALCVWSGGGSSAESFVQESIPVSTIPFPWNIGFVMVPLVFFPVALLWVIGIQYVNPLSAKRWTVPGLNTPFLTLRDPLHFFHAGAYGGLGFGMGFLIAAPFKGADYFLLGCSGLSGFLGMLLGIRLCIRIFSERYADGEARTV